MKTPARPFFWPALGAPLGTTLAITELRNLQVRWSEPSADAARSVPRLYRHLAPAVLTCALVCALILGWLHRDDGTLTPEHGLGYWLGIAGGSAMALLLLYPLRKRVRFLGFLGSIPSWFRIHMMLGLIGPLLILFHANFKFGSTNSNVALISMLLVAGSGIVGRYLYGKIHRGLYGAKADIDSIISDADALTNDLGDDLPFADDLLNRLDAFRNEALVPSHGVLSGGAALIALGAKERRCRRRVMAEAKAIIASEGEFRRWPRWVRKQRLAAVRQHLKLFFGAVRKAAALHVYERLFAMWHILHLPLFILLILTTVLHIIAVHTF